MKNFKKICMILGITFLSSLYILTFIIFIDTTSIKIKSQEDFELKTNDLFDGMYIKYNFLTGSFTYDTNFTYSPYTSSLYYETWNIDFMGTPASATWIVDTLTRLMSGGSAFGDGNHTPVWIFTNTSLYDTIPIAIAGAEDHDFYVARDFIFDLPGFGLIEVWELEDLIIPGGIGWYEKSTGILLNGTFFYDEFNPSYNYTFEFVDTNVLFEYIIYDHDLSFSLETPVNPEIGNSYMINATVTNSGLNDEYDVDLFLYLDGTIVTSTNISSLPVGASETISYMWTPTEYRMYNFTGYAPPVPDETFTADNILTKIIRITESKLFDGMCTNYTFILLEEYVGPSHFLYSNISETMFQGDFWFNLEGSDFNCYYDVDSSTRIMTNIWGDTCFGEGHHDPGWIFRETYLGDNIPIAILSGEEHIFKVSDDLIYDLPGYGLVEVWVVEDLTIPGGIGWYEKSTGILLNGTFFFNDEFYPSFNYTFEFVDTNVQFTYYVSPSLTITTPDNISSWETGTSQGITWTSTDTISDVKIELYKDGAFVMEIVASTPNDGSYSWDIPSELDDSTQYQIKISDVSNSATYDFSDNFEIKKPSEGPPGIPGYDLYLLISIICIVSVIFFKNRFKVIK